MLKKTISFLLALALLSFSVPALAETPSKTTEDLTKITSVESQDGVARSALIYIREEPSDLATTQLNAITVFLAKKNPVTDYFSDEEKAEIEKQIPEGTELSNLIMSEFVSLGIGDYLESYGDITSTFLFPTEFKETQIVVAVLGYPGADGEIGWHALATEVAEGGLRIIFPTDVMLEAGHDAVLTILSY